MRIEPNLNQDKLRKLLRDRYLLEVVRLTFVPFGIDSWSYLATCHDGSQAFVKLSRRVASAPPTPSEVPLMAALASRQVAVPRPVADCDGGFVNAVDGYEVQVLEYLEGRSLEDETVWPDDLYGQLAETVATVHASTDAIRHLVERVELYELPFLPPFARVLTAVETGAALPADGAPALATLRGMVMPRGQELRRAFSRLETLRDLAKARSSDGVLCHTDIWGSNLLVSNDGRLYLLDWNGALIGPPEHDLFMFAGTDFFPADRFESFLDRYEARGGPVRLDAKTFGFYFYRRNLEDLALSVDAMAQGQMEAMGPDAMLGVIADLLAELPRLESRITHVAAVLSDVRPPSA